MMKSESKEMLKVYKLYKNEPEAVFHIKGMMQTHIRLVLCLLVEMDKEKDAKFNKYRLFLDNEITILRQEKSLNDIWHKK